MVGASAAEAGRVPGEGEGRRAGGWGVGGGWGGGGGADLKRFVLVDIS